MRELRCALWFPVYMVMYLSMEKLFPVPLYWTQTPLDALIPFCEAFVTPTVSGIPCSSAWGCTC